MSYLQKQFSFIWNHRIEIRMSVLICMHIFTLNAYCVNFWYVFWSFRWLPEAKYEKVSNYTCCTKNSPKYTQEPQPTWLGTRHLTSSAVAVDQFNVKLCWLRCGEIRCNDLVIQPWSGSLSSFWLIHNLCALRYQVMYPRYHCDTC